MNKLSFVALDLETTGLNELAEIIEIGLVKFFNGNIIDEYQSFLKPSSPIPKEIEELTGITNEMVKDKASWSLIEAEVLDFIGDNFLVAHNASFDAGFINKVTDKLLDKLWIDTYNLSKIALPTLSNYKLVDMAQHFNFKEFEHHRAVNDASISGNILLKLSEILSQFSPFLIEENIRLLQNKDAGLVFILKNIQKDIISSFGYDKHIHSNIDEEYTNTSLNIKDPAQALKTDGIISRCYNNYEYRIGQVRMLKVVEKAFLESKHATIEAGTGIGKSLAYLIPALIWAQENSKKVIIATHTIALQEQLYKKEIPFLEKCFQVKLPIAIVKGRNNYICKRRFEKNKLLADPEFSKNIFLIQINNWLAKTQLGDKEELNLREFENEYWNQISSQTETCLGRKCSFYYNECLYMNNKRHSERSNIIITNHALLLQNAKINNKLLPEYEYAIVDEAHNLEEEATMQFATKVSLLKIIKVCNQISKGKNIGLIDRINFQIKESVDINASSLISENINTVKQEIKILKDKTMEINEIFSNSTLSNLNEFRITKKERSSDDWLFLFDQLFELNNFLKSLNIKLSKINSYLEESDMLEDFSKEMDFIINIIYEKTQTLTVFLEGEKVDYVYWINSSRNFNINNLTLSIAPIEIGSILNKNLFNIKKSIILTSATLRVAGNFNYVIKSLGLQDYDVLQFTANSPFNYKENSLVCIPTDISDPSLVSDEKYTLEIIENIKSILKIVKGGILILLTSNKMLNNIYYTLKRDIELKNKNILAAGKDGSRTTVINKLKDNKDTVVLGVNSFWEGIDVKGDALSTVIIVKLPFSPPSRPVVAARLDKFRENGEMGFFAYSLPNAILKFRQGYGRLIRDGTDYGTLIVLDKRIITKRYGKQFLYSLPSQKIIQGTSDQICASLKEWIK